MATEKRRHPRVEVSWPVTIISADHLVRGKTKNLSRVGTLIRCSELPELPYSFQLVFNPTGHKILLAYAERVWSKTFIGDSSISYTMGVRFTFVPDQDYELISETISSYV